MHISPRADFIDQSNPRGAELCNVTIAFTVLSIVVVGLRVAIRTQRKNLGYDDAWICLALVCRDRSTFGELGADLYIAVLGFAHGHSRDQRAVRLRHTTSEARTGSGQSSALLVVPCPSLLQMHHLADQALHLEHVPSSLLRHL